MRSRDEILVDELLGWDTKKTRRAIGRVIGGALQWGVGQGEGKEGKFPKERGRKLENLI